MGWAIPICRAEEIQGNEPGGDPLLFMKAALRLNDKMPLLRGDSSYLIIEKSRGQQVSHLSHTLIVAFGRGCFPAKSRRRSQCYIHHVPYGKDVHDPSANKLCSAKLYMLCCFQPPEQQFFNGAACLSRLGIAAS